MVGPKQAPLAAVFTNLPRRVAAAGQGAAHELPHVSDNTAFASAVGRRSWRLSRQNRCKRTPIGGALVQNKECTIRRRPVGQASGVAAKDGRTMIMPIQAPSETEALDILIVEDLPAGQKLLDLILRGAGHRVRVAANGLEAIRSFREAPAGSDLDGSADADSGRLANQHDSPCATIVGAAGADYRHDGLWAGLRPRRFSSIGVDAFLPKPIEAQQLVRLVTRTDRRNHHMSPRARRSRRPTLPSPTEESPEELAQIDIPGTLIRLNGDRELLTALVGFFFEDFPALLDEIREWLRHAGLDDGAASGPQPQGPGGEFRGRAGRGRAAKAGDHRAPAARSGERKLLMKAIEVAVSAWRRPWSTITPASQGQASASELDVRRDESPRRHRALAPAFSSAPASSSSSSAASSTLICRSIDRPSERILLRRLPRVIPRILAACERLPCVRVNTCDRT